MRNNLATWAGADEAAIKRGADRVVDRPWEQKKTERDFKQQPAIRDVRGVVCLRVSFVAVWFLALSEALASLSVDTTVNIPVTLSLRRFTEIRNAHDLPSPTPCSLCIFDTNRKGKTKLLGLHLRHSLRQTSQWHKMWTCVCPPPYAAVVMTCRRVCKMCVCLHGCAMCMS